MLYKKLIIKIFIHLFKDHEFIGDLDRTKTINRTKILVQKLIDKTENTFLIRLLEIIKKSSRLDKVSDTTEYEDAIANVT